MSAMSPLSPRQKDVWSMLRKGLSISEVADRLDTSFQNVHQTMKNAEAKLTKALMDTATTNNIQVQWIHPDDGMLYGYHPMLNLDTIVTYSLKHGIRVWYWHENPEEIPENRFMRESKTYLLDLAEERGIKLREEDTQLHTGRLARIVFGQLVPEVNK